MNTDLWKSDPRKTREIARDLDEMKEMPDISLRDYRLAKATAAALDRIATLEEKLEKPDDHIANTGKMVPDINIY